MVIEINALKLTDPLLVGIHSGGVWIAEALHQRLGTSAPLGHLDISFYRDDFSRMGLHPVVRPSNLPEPVEGRPIILIDDVLYTGRTIRAALNEIFDYGRPERVILAVLAERNGRELPIQADIAGMRLDLPANAYLQLQGPEPLQLRQVSR
ncbi:MAG: bifunctional pyr operon transcriptional regulator/uracil phosphoribosyltransferase PyrR [Gammaproteobacteria bacterium]|nr:bifunctional pyr operon transcriptional regulator/uracil phosphoribosyltransferase PyrR [Gammaproteobacteria bacterium]